MLQRTVLDELADIVGYTATCALVAWYADRNLYVPARWAGHPLCRVIGVEAMQALVEARAGETLAIPADAGVPLMRRDREIAERYAEGWTPGRVATDYGLTLRRAQQLRDELDARGWLAYAVGRLGTAG